MLGRFSIPAVDPGQYEMIVSHIGYKSVIVLIEVKPNFHSAIHINLKKSTPDLFEIKINSKKT